MVKTTARTLFFLCPVVIWALTVGADPSRAAQRQEEGVAAEILIPSRDGDLTKSARSSDFLRRSQEGWFWYEVQPELVEPVPPEPVEPKSTKEADASVKDVQPAVTEPFSVEWLRTNMPILMDRAINDPTKENVEAFEYAKRVMLDKSQRYAEMTRDVVANDPFLDENNRVPLATFAKGAFLKQKRVGLEEAMKYLSTKVGIWMFFDSTCAFCHLQARQILDLNKQFNFHTRFISMNGQGMPMLPEYYRDSGQAKRIGLKLTPTTVLVVPPDKYYIISQGAMARDQLEERILVAADSNGLLPEEYRKGTQMFDKGVLTTEDMQDGASDDPKVWVKRLKERLQVRY